MDLTDALEAANTADRPRLDRDRGVLVGSRCETCGAVSWPSRAVCHRCGTAAMREVVFAARGALLVHTTVWVARPGLTPPYTLCQVRLADGGPLVFGHLRNVPDGGAAPATVRLVVDPDPGAVPPFWFEPAGS